jgi:hypothetical protein
LFGASSSSQSILLSRSLSSLNTNDNRTMPQLTPHGVFTAILLFPQQGRKTENTDNDLEFPLLQHHEKQQAVEVEKGDDNTTFIASSPLDDGSVMKKLKALAFMCGCMVAWFSQYVLSETLWDPSILLQPTSAVVAFSCVWSFWTCFMVFAAMLLLIHAIYRGYNIRSNDPSWDDCVFQIEAHLIVGALLSISLSWIMMDVLQLGRPGYTVHNIVLLVVAVVAYVLFFRCQSYCCAEDTTTKQQDLKTMRSSDMMLTFQLVAGTLGLIVGICSQFLLSIALWKDRMTKPVIDNVILFSLLWSFSTVVISFAGCLALRLLTVDEKDRMTAERIFLRMESHYVFCSLIGICVAWILMDLVLGMSDQIFPSFVMLAASLAAFRLILHCFPEEKCLEEIEMKNKASANGCNTRKNNSSDKKLMMKTVTIAVV